MSHEWSSSAHPQAAVSHERSLFVMGGDHSRDITVGAVGRRRGGSTGTTVGSSDGGD